MSELVVKCMCYDLIEEDRDSNGLGAEVKLMRDGRSIVTRSLKSEVEGLHNLRCTTAQREHKIDGDGACVSFWRNSKRRGVSGFL